jgi:hypothetical protein
MKEICTFDIAGKRITYWSFHGEGERVVSWEDMVGRRVKEPRCVGMGVGSFPFFVENVMRKNRLVDSVKDLLYKRRGSYLLFLDDVDSDGRVPNVRQSIHGSWAVFLERPEHYGKGLGGRCYIVTISETEVDQGTQQGS